MALLLTFSCDFLQVIKGRLYIGNRAQANNWTLLHSLGTTHIVNVSRETKASFEGTVPFVPIALSCFSIPFMLATPCCICTRAPVWGSYSTCAVQVKSSTTSAAFQTQ